MREHDYMWRVCLDVFSGFNRSHQFLVLRPVIFNAFHSCSRITDCAANVLREHLSAASGESVLLWKSWQAPFTPVLFIHMFHLLYFHCNDCNIFFIPSLYRNERPFVLLSFIYCFQGSALTPKNMFTSVVLLNLAIYCFVGINIKKDCKWTFIPTCLKRPPLVKTLTYTSMPKNLWSLLPSVFDKSERVCVMQQILRLNVDGVHDFLKSAKR